MKLNKVIFPLMIALVAMSATTGCKKGFSGKVTNLPGARQSAVTGETPDLNTKPFDPNAGGAGSNPGGDVTSKPGQFATSDTWDPANCDQDRGALADQTVHFAFDSAAILSKEENKLVIVSEKLKSDASAKLLIEGHCDERGTEEYNRSLGERRALALREALARAGIDPVRIRTISYGKDKPADSGHDEAAWSKNRRGEFILCHLKAGA
jgi:peptidoglycan-associated lipoprotein